VFDDRGTLQLGVDGRLTLHCGVEDIPFEHLSSGEKVVALLAVRLLVLGSSTRAAFLWLDEPVRAPGPAYPAARRVADVGSRRARAPDIGDHIRGGLGETAGETGQATLLRVRSADVAWQPPA